MPTFDEALEYLLDFAREPRPTDHSDYGYEIYLPNVVRAFFRETTGDVQANQVRDVSPLFLDAAWELCRMGVLRPNVVRFFDQSTEEGQGYSLTEQGRAFVADPDRPDIALLPGRSVQLIEQLAATFGDGFFQRGTEAMRCYRTGSYLETSELRSTWPSMVESVRSY